MAFFLLAESKPFFIAVEVLLILSFIISYRFYKAFTNPLKLIKRGSLALADQDFNITFTETGSHEMNELIQVYNSMIHKIREERVSIKEQHYFLEKLIEASPNAIVLLNFNDEIESYNPAAEKMLDMSEFMIGKSIETLSLPFFKAALKIEPGKSEIISLDGWRKYKCHISDFIHQGFKRSFLLVEELSNEILETEKKAYGKVIRMMAHEVNNSIGAVNSILHSLEEIHDERDEENKDIKEVIQTAIGRNDRLNTFMKNFADVIRLSPTKKESTNLNEFISKTADFMKLLAEKRNVTFAFELDPKGVVVDLDLAQMERVIINIVKNAIESIGENGQVKFITQSNPTQLIIEDNGQGVSTENEEDLFKPFFSTKPDGQGIGLTLIKEILHQHEISFSLKTGADGLTRFNMVF
jgi:nitrogen fixation/metabolism regulation signal transduction histidine kinase